MNRSTRLRPSDFNLTYVCNFGTKKWPSYVERPKFSGLLDKLLAVIMRVLFEAFNNTRRTAPCFFYKKDFVIQQHLLYQATMPQVATSFGAHDFLVGDNPLP